MTPEVDGFVGGVNQAPHALPRRRAGPSIATHDERFAVLLRNMVHVQQRFIGKTQVVSTSGHGSYTLNVHISRTKVARTWTSYRYVHTSYHMATRALANLSPKGAKRPRAIN